MAQCQAVCVRLEAERPHERDINHRVHSRAAALSAPSDPAEHLSDGAQRRNSAPGTHLQGPDGMMQDCRSAKSLYSEQAAAAPPASMTRTMAGQLTKQEQAMGRVLIGIISCHCRPPGALAGRAPACLAPRPAPAPITQVWRAQWARADQGLHTAHHRGAAGRQRPCIDACPRRVSGVARAHSRRGAAPVGLHAVHAARVAVKSDQQPCTHLRMPDSAPSWAAAGCERVRVHASQNWVLPHGDGAFPNR